MSAIVPTITAVAPDEYAVALEKLSFAPRIHVDIADGDFAPNKTVNLNQIYWEKDENLRQVDLHLMLEKPSEWLHQIISLAPDLVIFHVEIPNATEILPKICEYLKKFQIKFGLAILAETQIKNVAKLIEIADHVLIFGGHLGYQGGTADLSQLEKVAQIKTINATAEIAWDGGANAENVAEIANSGVNAINVGSAISRAESPVEIYEQLTHVLE